VPQYYPMVHTAFWAEYRLFGSHAAGYHLVNVAIHALDALLLSVVLRRLGVRAAWLAAAVFAVHPVQVESVAWVTELKNVLSTAFYLGAALCFIRFLELGTGGPSRPPDAGTPRHWSSYAFGSLLYVAALLSKTVTASFPAAVLLVTWWKRRRLAIRDVLPLVPLFAAGAAAGLATAWIEKHHVGAAGKAWDLGAAERFLIAGRAVWFYAGKLVFPWPLIFVYPRWHLDAGAPLQYVPVAAAIALVAALWLARKRIGSGPLVAVLFFGGTLVPALGFFDVYPMRYSFVADHFQYLASAGLIALFAAAAALAAERFRLPGPALASLILAILASLTWRQARIYRDAETLWRDTLAKNPSAWMAQTNLGEILVSRGQVDEGVALYREAIRLEPTLVEPRLNLGETLLAQGKAAEAITLMEETVRLYPDNPAARYNLGTAYLKTGRTGEGVSELTRATELQRGFVEAEYNLGVALLLADRLDEAAAHLREAIRLNPSHGPAHRNLARVLERQGRLAEAASEREVGLRLENRRD